MALKKISVKKLILFAFIAVETVIYVIFNVLAAVDAPDPIYLKYSGVLLCFAVSLIPVIMRGRSADNAVVSVALLFTAISDLFILVLQDYFEIGLVTFITVQGVYFYRLYSDRLNKIYISLIIRLAVAVALVIIFAAIGKLDLLVAECAIYITLLIGNVIDAFIICGNGFKNLLFAIGLLLFLGCDICVGLHNFGIVLGVQLPDWLTSFVGVAMWAFYLPSQVLITSTSFIKNGIVKGNKADKKGVEDVTEG